MPINVSEFPIQIETNLKANKQHTKFYINFKKESSRIRKILDYSTKEWDKRTRASKAKMELASLKQKELNSGVNFNENSTLNQAKDVYFDHSGKSKAWAEELKSMYRLYCQNSIGKKRIKDIRKVHIDELRKSMEKQGKSKQTVKGCSPRTIKKVLYQTLKPILQYAVDNKVLDSLPPIELPKQGTRKKRLVTHAQEKLIMLYATIDELYSKDAFYRALFLFALYGRRWNEIRTLHWSDIDWKKKTYTIRAENNKIGQNQTYDLAKPIETALLELGIQHDGLIFKSPITGKELYAPKKQLTKLKNKANIPELTMHYFRHILVSTMGEQGIAGTILSASLGHTNLDTVNDFYLSSNHTKASKEANESIDALLNKE